MKILIEVLGYLLMLLGAVHVIFPKYFSWEKELSSLSLVNRQMMQVHTFFIAVGVGLMGLLCASSAGLLLSTELGKRTLLGMAFFWGLRFFTQFFWYSSDLWKGKRFETIIHVCFACFWLLITLVFLFGALTGKQSF